MEGRVAKKLVQVLLSNLHDSFHRRLSLGLTSLMELKDVVFVRVLNHNYNLELNHTISKSRHFLD